FYGYCWQVSIDEGSSTEQFVAEDDDDERLYEWEKSVLKSRGVEDPWERNDILNPKDPDQPYASRGLTEIGRMLVGQWKTAKQAVKEEFDVEYFTHGGPDWRCPAIAIARTHTTAWRGSPKQIDWEMMPPGETWNAELDAWCELMGIVLDPEHKGEEWDGPGWFLVSDWTH